jgi:hypothetical protein
MAIDPPTIRQLIETELATVNDTRVVARVRSLLVDPRPVSLGWDYGEPGQTFPGWLLLDDAVQSDTGVAYCEHGFGPGRPWGLVWLGGEPPFGMGMDSGWFPTLMEAFFGSFVSVPLPIWRVFVDDGGDWPGTPLTGEGTWDAAWAECYAARAKDPSRRFNVWHSTT